MRMCLVVGAALAILAAPPAPHKITFVRVFPNAGQIGLFVAASDGSDEHPRHGRSLDDGFADEARETANDHAEQTLANRRPAPEQGSDARLVTIDVTTGARVDLPADAGLKMNPSPMPGGDIGYVRKDAAGTGAGIYYTNGARGPRGDVRTASWSPDGRRVVFHRRLAAPIPMWKPHFSRDPLYQLTLTGGQLPSFSPAGDRYVTNRRPLGSRVGASLLVARTGADTSEAIYQDKARNVLAPQCSPRGELIVFSRQADGDYDIYTVKPDGTAVRRLTFSRGNDAHMAWSPDGELIAFAPMRMGFKDEVPYTDAPQPQGELFVMRYDGTRLRQLTDNQWEDGTPAWQPSEPLGPRSGRQRSGR